MENNLGAELLSSVKKGLKQAFPPVMAQLLRELVKPNPDFSDIAQVIGMDPMMSAAVLNLVNSPFYGLSQRITSLERAAVVLGTKEILKIALSVSYMKQKPGTKKNQAKTSFANWRLIVWSAIAAELIAERICPEQADLAYLCTLLKDLSLLLINRTIPEALTPMCGDQLLCLTPGQLEAEAEAWGMSHAALTLAALEQWGIPDLGCGCIAHHHDMEHLENHSPLGQALILATQWAELTGGCDRDPLLLVQFDLTLRQRMDLSAEEIEELRQTCVQKYRSMLAILNLEEAAPDQRLYEHSVQSMQHFHFQTMEIHSISGGQSSVARTVARHLAWNFDLSEWQLSLRSPLDESWVLFDPDENSAIAETASADLDTNLPWRFKKQRLLLIASGEKWGELRLRAGQFDQDALAELAIYVRFLSRAYEQYCMRQAVMESKAHTLDALPVGVARLDASGRIHDLNAALFQLLGTPKKTKGQDILDSLHLGTQPESRTEWDLFLGSPDKKTFSKIVCQPHKNTQPPTHQCLYVSAHKESGSGTDSILFLAEDLSEISEMEVQAFKHSEFMERLVDSMQDIVLTVDASGIISFVSPGHRDRLEGVNLFSVSKPAKNSNKAWGPEQLETTDGPLEIAFQARDGSYRPTECIFSPLRGSHSEAPAYLMVGRDLTKVKRLEEKIKRQAVYDGLTDLFNHYQFHSLLEREARRAQRTSRPMGLIFIDLDDFKDVNDTQGHQAGDKVLRKVAAALREQVRQGTDFPCRYGGDEFAVIATEVGTGGLQSLAARIKAAVDASLVGQVRMSVGTAMLKQGESPESLLKRTDNAAYAAKAKGGDTIVDV